MVDNIIGQDQQPIYRIDYNKHYTIGGAPPILVLQKDSTKPPIIILEGVRTYPLKTPIIRDERRDKSQGYIFQDERKPPHDDAQLNSTALYNLPSNSGGEKPYTYHQRLYDQEHPMNQSQDSSSFGNYSSNLSYNNNTSVSFSPWMYGRQRQPQQSYDTDNYDKNIYSENDTMHTNYMYSGGYTQNEPYHWQPSLHQQDSWTTPQNQSYLSPYFENSSLGGYNNTYNDTMYRREGGGMPLMPMTPRQAHYDSSYNYSSPSSPWLAYYNNADNSTMMMPGQEGTYPWSHYQYTTPQLRQNTNLQSDTGQPAFRLVNGPRRSKSVTFAPLPDHVAT